MTPPEPGLNDPFRFRSSPCAITDGLRILIVEDETRIAQHLAQALTQAGYAVDSATDGEQADVLVTSGDYDVILLDLGLPKIDGLTLLRRWRAAGLHCPVLILTARGSWHEKVEGIDSGADDYVAKPFRVEEVLARVRALIRRASGAPSVELTAGAITLDVRSSTVTLSGEPVDLTSFELRVLSYLLHHSQHVVSRAELIEHIYAQDFDRDSNTVEVFIARLRRKLGPDCIKTVRGLGYRIGTA